MRAGAQQPPATFLAGLNYWPAETAMHWWSRFDRAAARADLERIAAAGFSHLRFFLLWEAFQPAPDQVSQPALHNLESFANAAASAGLLLQPTLFTGHMSGANWLPAFATRPAGSRPARFPTMTAGQAQPLVAVNWYADEQIIQAQELLAREVASALARHPAVWSWDLGNENSNVCRPETVEAGRRWLDRMVGALRRGGSQRPITFSLHMEDLEQDRRLGPRQVAEACDYLAMHGYPLYASWARHDLDAVLLPFLGLVTSWLAGGRPVLFQEFGLPTRPPGWPRGGRSGRSTLFDEDQGRAFYEQALAELRREEFLGAFAWCAHDYVESLWDQPPLARAEHERFFGLFRADGSPKPALAIWQDLQQGRLAPPIESPRGTAWIDLTPEQYWQSPAQALRRLYARFVTL